MNDRSPQHRAVLLECYRAAIAAVEPAGALHGPLRETAPGNAGTWIIAVGKAAHGMARAIVTWLAEHQREPAGGIIIGTDAAPSPHRSIEVLVGDHPIPHAQSERAAAALGEMIRRIPATDEVHVAISGGTSALIAAPLDGLTMQQVTESFEQLMRSGMDIAAMNAARKKVTRWSAGRLATALQPRPVHAWLISDVPGDDPATIGSGPCASPSPSDPPMSGVRTRIVATSAIAQEAAARAARERGFDATIIAGGLAGDATAMGRRIVDEMHMREHRNRILVWGGETTVALSPVAGHGGRAQQAALAAAQALQGENGLVLVAGTDGRDGPTDAAGALVDGETWHRIMMSGRNPAEDLDRCNAYDALDCANALIRTGATGTNVMDIALAMDCP